ncbi:MAG: NAD-dependent epimerase/dehydratase family protein [Roseovarius sp.]
MRHAIVTGGAGFIGSHLVEHLLRQGTGVTVLDNFSTGTEANLAVARGLGTLRVIEGTTTSRATLDAAMEGADCVFHLAAVSGVQDCIGNWSGAHEANATATIALFEAAQRAGPLPVVYASSAAVYGDRSGETCHEEMAERPISPYGADKLACEHQARAFWHVHGLPTAGLRFFNVYGPRQSSASPYAGALAKFGRNCVEGRGHTIFGDGLQARDFVHVNDAVRGLLAAMQKLCEAPEALVCNICTGRSVSMLHLIDLIEHAGGRKPGHLLFEPARPGEIRHSRGDTARMESLLGLADPMTLEAGIRDTLRWMQSARAHRAAAAERRAASSAF